MTNSTYYSTALLDTAPPSVAKSGTVSTNGKQVYGTNTKFLTELKPGDWIFRTGTTQIRQVANIISDISLVLAEPFTTDISPAIALKAVPQSRMVSLTVYAPGAGGKINGTALAAEEKVEFNKYTPGYVTGNVYVDPVVVDGTGGALKITILT